MNDFSTYFMLCEVSTFATAFNLRVAIRATYEYKKTNRQVREFGTKEEYKKLRRRLPYKELIKNCKAPGHMIAFQILRIVNWALNLATNVIGIGSKWFPQLENIMTTWMNYTGFIFYTGVTLYLVYCFKWGLHRNFGRKKKK